MNLLDLCILLAGLAALFGFYRMLRGPRQTDRVVALDFGRKIAEGTPSQIQSDPQVIKAYLGEEEADEQLPTGAAA